MITILDESVLPKAALDVLNIIVLLYVMALTPLLIWIAYKKHKKLEAEISDDVSGQETDVQPDDETAPQEEQ